MYSLPVPATAIFGLPATGRMARTAITGCQAPGYWLPSRASCGRLVIGVGAGVFTSGMRAIGALTSDFTVASIMASDTWEPAMRADTGGVGLSSTTAQS